MKTSQLRLLLCISLVLLGASVMAGWLMTVEPLKSVAPGLSTMKFNAAVGFVLVGLGLALAPTVHGYGRMVSASCGALAAILGALTLFQYVSGLNLGIDELVVRDTGTLIGSGYPGRMSPLTATVWLALGCAIVVLATRSERRWLTAAHLLGGYAGFISFLSAAGYVFGAEAFWGIGFYTFVAVHTAVGLMASAAATLLTRPEEGWLGGFGDAPAARATLLELLPVSVILPVALGLLLLFASGLGAFNAPFAFALFVPLMTVALLSVGFRVAQRARIGELALRESESRSREQLEELEAIYESSPMGLALITPDLRFRRVNRRLAEMNGAPAADHIGRTVAELVPDLDEQVRQIARRFDAGETIANYEISGETPAAPGVVRSWLEYWVPLRAPDGGLRGISAVVEEITERKRAEDRRKLLIDELNHRVRNTLAVVQAMARQTLGDGRTPPEVARAFEARLQALAAAHTILTRENWEGADLAEVVQMAAGAQGAGRLIAEGPPVALKPALAVSLSLALHELATNAAKYGALSNDEGRVRVEWRLKGETPPILKLRWRERGGPPVQRPERRGFGARLLERGLEGALDGKVNLDFDPEGLVCEIEARHGVQVSPPGGEPSAVP